MLPLAHVTTVPAKSGYAVCVSGKFIVVPESYWSRVALYRAESFTALKPFGSRGTARGQFDFGELEGGVCAGTDPRTTSVLVADCGNGRVSEHSLPTGKCTRVLGLTHLLRPRRVDANRRHVAVSDYGKVGEHRWRSRVLVFDADATEDEPPLCVLGEKSPTLRTPLDYPCGLRLSRDGTAVFVADRNNDRVVQFTLTTSAGAVVATAATHGFRCPHDVLEVDAGWTGRPSESGKGPALLVADSENGAIVGVFGKSAARYGAYGYGAGKFAWPSGLALLPDHGLVVRDHNDRKFQVFERLGPAPMH